MFLAVKEVVKTLRIIGEPEGGRLDSVVRDALDQGLRGATIEFVSRR